MPRVGAHVCKRERGGEGEGEGERERNNSNATYGHKHFYAQKAKIGDDLTL